VPIPRNTAVAAASSEKRLRRARGWCVTASS
jgi:hypothetical protein